MKREPVAKIARPIRWRAVAQVLLFIALVKFVAWVLFLTLAAGKG